MGSSLERKLGLWQTFAGEVVTIVEFCLAVLEGNCRVTFAGEEKSWSTRAIRTTKKETSWALLNFDLAEILLGRPLVSEYGYLNGMAPGLSNGGGA